MDKTVDVKLLENLYDIIFESVTKAPGSSEPLFDPTKTQVQILRTGLFMKPEDYDGARSLSKPNGDLAKAEKLARLLDKVPNVGEMWVDSGNSVDMTYGKILHAANTNMPDDPKQREIHDKASSFLHVTKKNPFTDEDEAEDSPAYKNYLELKTAYAEALSKYRSALYDPQYDPSTVEGQNKFQIESPKLQAEIDAVHSKLIAGNAKTVEQALAVMEFSGNIPGMVMLDSARKIYDRTSKDSREGGTWHLTYCEPENWFRDDAGFVEKTISSSSLKSDRSSHATQFGLAPFGGWGLFQFGAQGSGSVATTKEHHETKDITIKFKLATVLVSRPWMDYSILNMGGWFFDESIEGLGKGSISTGSADANNDGMMPLMPVAMIVAKDVEVSGNWTESDKSTLDVAVKGGGFIGYGPFGLGFSGGHQTSTGKEEAKFDGGTISAPGIQIIGWISQVIPLCPKEKKPDFN